MNMKKRRLREWISLRIAENPAGMILGAICVLNIVFFAIAALVISNLAPSNLAEHSFWESVFYTITMILDAGCISYVVSDIGQAGVALIIACLVIVLVGSITFTGAVIGYVTNYISDFIGKSNAGARKLEISNHTVILNWNNRASEIVNDLLYSEKPETVVILVPSGRDRVEREINERLTATIENENWTMRFAAEKMPIPQRWIYKAQHKFHNRLRVLVYEGDTFSTQKLHDISIMLAKSIIILSEDIKNTACRYDYEERLAKMEKGNSNTVKTLIQVAELSGNEHSADNQKIVVEVGDAWTEHLVSRIIAHKEVEGKCTIVPIMVNRVLGQILSQFSIMPELNSVYSELFSNKGAQFFCRPMRTQETEDERALRSLKEDVTAIPLSKMEARGKEMFYFLATSDKDVNEKVAPSEATMQSDYQVKLTENFWLEKRNIIILGHNSKSIDVMEGFNAFRNEWNFNTPELIEKNGGPEVLNIEVIDDEKSLDKIRHYKAYPQVTKVVSADLYNREKICESINEFIDKSIGDVSILILSDDMADADEIDSNALTYLIYVRDIIKERMDKDPDFDLGSIDVVVEILNPKNYDIVRSYSASNIVISNRYISKMIMQIGEKESIYHFYNDILTYDTANDSFESKEMYSKKVSRFFQEIPGPCTAAELIRAVYNASPEDNRSVVCGYTKANGDTILFDGDQEKIRVELEPTDKLVLFSNH